MRTLASRLLAGFVLALLCAAPAWAAPAFVQAHSCSSTTTCAFTAPPTNGNVVSVIIDNTTVIGSVTVKDSNGVALTEHQPSGNCATANALCFAAYDYVVSGSPTATYTLAGMTATGTNGGVMVEMSGVGVTGTNFAANNAVTVSTNIFATIAGVTNTDAQIEEADYTVGAGSCGSPGLSNNGPGTLLVCSFRSLATSTASSTGTLTAAGGNLTNGVVLFADYPAGGGGGGAFTPVPWIGAFMQIDPPPCLLGTWTCV